MSNLLLTLNPGGDTWAQGSILAGAPRCERTTAAWDRNGDAVADADQPHREIIDGVPCLFIGRRTRNLLPPEFASFASMPAGLSLPVVAVTPADETAQPSTGYLGVHYQFSAHVRGQGSVTLKLSNLERPEEATETVFALTPEWQRVCIALDGVFAPRRLQPAIVADTAKAEVRGLMLEPHVVTYRSRDRALLVPNPGAWTPGGQTRDRDRIALPLTPGALPRSGTIDFWFRPTWHALHPQHTFFQTCHGYFGLEIRDSAPVFYAGQKACPWMYYWEWGQAEGYAADSWHHYALVWRAEGGATLYFDGQARAHVEQVPAHAFTPARAGDLLIIGGARDGTMSLDPNVPGELDGFLAGFRLWDDALASAGVLVAMEASAPVSRDTTPPPSAAFLRADERHLIARAQDHCWFVHNLAGDAKRLVTAVGRGDDHHPPPNLRPSTSDKPRVLESLDGGRTWQPGQGAPKFEFGLLSGGRHLQFGWRVDGEPPRATMHLTHADGRVEEFEARFDTSALPQWRPNTLLCACKLLELREGGYLLFVYGNYPGVGVAAGQVATAVFVFRSTELRTWTALACPYRADGIHDHFNETAAVQLPSGRILILMRTGGWNTMLAKGMSDDGGVTWSPALPSGLRGIQPRMRLLNDGSILVVTGRPGIILALSADGGESFASCLCAEDDRIHEFSDYFGWYGYSCMNNGMAVDEAAGRAFISYDLLDARADADGTLLNACFVRPYDLVRIGNYARQVIRRWRPGDADVVPSGAWATVRGNVMVTHDSGAGLAGSFEGTGLVALLETSTHAGTARLEIDGGGGREIPLFLPYRRMQRLLLAHGLKPGRHTFRLTLDQGWDPEHKFANPEMPMLGGMQTIHMAGTTPERRLAVYGLEVLKS